MTTETLPQPAPDPTLDSLQQFLDGIAKTPLLTARDQIKFVICSREDYDWAKALVAEHELVKRCTVFFSPSKGEITARQLADWIVEDRLPVRFQMQLHKILWNDEPGR